jgi:broad specificity phosphatase PhoE
MNYEYLYNKYKTKYISLKKQKGGMIEKEIYFIRHGETEWNILGKAQGQEADITLNENGEIQAEKTGKYLKNFRINSKLFDCILSSPLKRASKTAKIIADEIRFNKEKIIYMNELLETKTGKLSGLTNDDDFKKKYVESTNMELDKIKDPIEIYELGDYQKADIFYTTVGGDVGIERYEELIPRINKLINYLKATICKKIIVVSHSTFLDELLKKIFNLNVLPEGSFANGKNCWICYCTFSNDKFKMISPPNTEHFSLFEK